MKRPFKQNTRRKWGLEKKFINPIVLRGVLAEREERIVQTITI